MEPIHTSDADYIRSATQSFRAYGPTVQGGLNILTDAAILDLVTTAALKALVNNTTPLNLENPNKVRTFVENFERLQRYSSPVDGAAILNDDVVTAANTFEGLITLIQDRSGIPAVYFEAFPKHYGGEQYRGNALNSVV